MVYIHHYSSKKNTNSNLMNIIYLYTTQHLVLTYGVENKKYQMLILNTLMIIRIVQKKKHLLLEQIILFRILQYM